MLKLNTVNHMLRYILFSLSFLFISAVGIANEIPGKPAAVSVHTSNAKLADFSAIRSVEIGTLSAVRFDHMVRLAWDTRYERANHGFEIERRAQDCAEWKTVGFVPSIKSAFEGHEYQFTDHGDFDKVTYYRIKQISENSTVNYSVSMAVLPEQYVESFEIVQTATRDSDAGRLLSITLSEAKSVSIQVMDTYGRPVDGVRYEFSLSAGHHLIPFTAHELPAGVYLLRLEGVDVVRTKTFVK